MSDFLYEKNDENANIYGNQIPSLQQQYPLDVSVDFTKLRANALRKYMAFHKIQEIPGSSQEQLAVAVARHFNQACRAADEENTIVSFLSYVKGEGKSGFSSKLPEYKQRKTFCQEHPVVEHVIEENEESNYSDSSRKRKSSDASISSSHTSMATAGQQQQKKKKRKARVYCICKGSSFGNMIACDNKKCMDRSNWYHMRCVGLDSFKDPPETWFCPSCKDNENNDIPENQYRKPVASVTYGDMISHALSMLPGGKGTFKEICDFVEKKYESQLNWKLESDQRKSPVWKSSVRKILFSNTRFRKHPDDKGLFCMAA